MLYRPQTLKSLTVDDETIVPDEYVHRFMKMEQGSVAFIEVKKDKYKHWTLWRVECIADKGGLLFFTAQCTKEQADKELAAERTLRNHSPLCWWLLN